MASKPSIMGEYNQLLKKYLKAMVKSTYGKGAIILNFKVTEEKEPWVYVTCNILTKDKYIKCWAKYDQIFEEMEFLTEEVTGVQEKLNM